MCLIVFAWRPGQPHPLIVAANRDEFHARPTLPLCEWEDAPGVLAGRDLQAGGTWMGLGPNGRFAALTNIRAPGRPVGARSRGELVGRYLRGDLSPAAYLAEVVERLPAYSGFNLLVGDAGALWYLNSQEARPRALAPGLYGLSNDALDSPWPKLLNAREVLCGCLDSPSTEALLELLQDPREAPDEHLPDTGVALDWERRLSSIFIVGEEYGTRSSTALIMHADGGFELVERRFGPNGQPRGETRLQKPVQ
ncbi:NRDE family protein [Stutzerimonas azotifigens]|uniref:NRDE family protein n=1 Tax=Stutzerimonas azotifigens TaxID=291995 RepID=UPI00041AD354|nr:NRDE family protein [Stutzerimonas azotifigens]